MSLGLPMATVERLHVEGRARKGRMDFKYEVIRLWEQPVRRFLTGGLGTLPLAPLCRLPGDAPLEEGLKPVVRRIAERLQREASSGDQAKLLTAAYILTGLRVSQRAARNLFEGVRAMQESTTYQAILEEGQAKGQTLALQKTLLRQGPQRFGPPSDAAQAAINAITDVARLERLTERLLLVATWQELLASE